PLLERGTGHNLPERLDITAHAGHPCLPVSANLGRQVALFDATPWNHDHQALDGIAQLADIPRPCVRAHGGESILAQTRLLLSVLDTALREEMLGQEGAVLAA